MRNKLLRLCPVFFFLSFLCVADVLVLRNNQELRGRVSDRGNYYEIRLDIGGVARVNKVDVKEVVRTPTRTKQKRVRIEPELMKLLEGRESAYWLVEAIRSGSAREDVPARLARLGDLSLKAVAECVVAKDARLQRTALDILGEVGSPDAVRLIERLFESEYESVRVASAKVLATLLGGESEWMLLRRAVTTKSKEERLALIALLARQRSFLLCPFLVEWLEGKDADVRRSAYSALKEIHSPSIVHFIFAHPLRVREESLFPAVVSRAHIPILISLLNSKDERKKRLSRLGLATLLKNRETAPAVALELIKLRDENLKNTGLRVLKRRFRMDLPADASKWSPLVENLWRPEVYVVRVGTCSRSSIRAIRRLLASLFRLESRAVSVSIPAQARGAGSKGYRAEPILQKLGWYKRSGVPFVVGVTNVEVRWKDYPVAYSPYLFGGVVLVSERSVGGDAVPKAFLHALRLSLGLPECSVRDCPGRGVYSVEDYGGVRVSLCQVCRQSVEAGVKWLVAMSQGKIGEALNSISVLARARGISERVLVERALLYEFSGDLSTARQEWDRLLSSTSNEHLKEILPLRQKVLAGFLPKRK